MLVLILTYLLSIASFLLGKLIYQRNINPVSVYAAIWCLSISGYFSGLIFYKEITTYAWFLIFIAWLSINFGSFFGSKYNKRIEMKNIRLYNIKPIYIIVIASNLLSFLSFIQRYVVYKKAYGGIYGILINYNNMYLEKMHRTIEISTIPYIGALALASAPYSFYLYHTKQKWGAVLFYANITICFMMSFITAGKTYAFIALSVIFGSYLYLNYYRINKLNIRKYFIILLLFIVVFSIISQYRKMELSYDKYATYESKFMQSIRNYVPWASTVVNNISGPLVVFSEFVNDEEYKQAYLAENTLFILYSLLPRLGLTERIPYFQSNYYIPYKSNVGTYLREIYSDFNVLGVVIIPFMFAFILSKTLYSRSDDLFALYCLFSFIFSLIVLSFFMLAIRWGDWCIGFMVSLLFSKIIKIKIFLK
jgi:oligosaccharide repeat unit polymerase